MPEVDSALSVHLVKKLQNTNELAQQPLPTSASTKKYLTSIRQWTEIKWLTKKM